MSDNYTEKEMKSIAGYIQKKERRMSALNTSIANMGGSNSIYGAELNDILVIVYEDKMPGSLDLQKSMPDLYPALKKVGKKEKEDEESEE